MNWNYELHAKYTIDIWASKRIYFAPPSKGACASQRVDKEKRTEVGEAREAVKAAEAAKGAPVKVQKRNYRQLLLEVRLVRSDILILL
jgi:hypothetical protein